MKKILSFLTKKPLALAAVALFSMSSFAQETDPAGGTGKDDATPQELLDELKVDIWERVSETNPLYYFDKVTVVDESYKKIYADDDNGTQLPALDFDPAFSALGSQIPTGASYFYVSEGAPTADAFGLNKELQKKDDEYVNSKGEVVTPEEGTVPTKGAKGIGDYLWEDGSLKKSSVWTNVSWLWADVYTSVTNAKPGDRRFLAYNEGNGLFMVTDNTSSEFVPAVLYKATAKYKPYFDPEEGYYRATGEKNIVKIINPKENNGGKIEYATKKDKDGKLIWKDYPTDGVEVETGVETTITARVVFDKGNTGEVSSTYLFYEIEDPTITPEPTTEDKVDEKGEFNVTIASTETEAGLKWTTEEVTEETTWTPETSNTTTENIAEGLTLPATVTVSAKATKTIKFKGEDVDVESSVVEKTYTINPFADRQDVFTEFKADPTPGTQVNLGQKIYLWFDLVEKYKDVYEIEANTDDNKQLTLKFGADKVEEIVDLHYVADEADKQYGHVYFTVPTDEKYANSQFWFDVPEGFYVAYTNKTPGTNEVKSLEKHDVTYTTGLFATTFILDCDLALDNDEADPDKWLTTDDSYADFQVYLNLDEQDVEVNFTDEAVAAGDPTMGASFTNQGNHKLCPIQKVEKIKEPNIFRVTFYNEEGKAQYIKDYLESDVLQLKGYILAFPENTFVSGTAKNKDNLSAHIYFTEAVDLTLEPLRKIVCEGTEGVAVKVVAKGKIYGTDYNTPYWTDDTKTEVNTQPSKIVLNKETEVLITGTNIHGEVFDDDNPVKGILTTTFPDNPRLYGNIFKKNNSKDIFFLNYGKYAEQMAASEDGKTYHFVLQQDNGVNDKQDYKIKVPAGAFSVNNCETKDFYGKLDVMAHPVWEASVRPYTFDTEEGATTLYIDGKATLDDLIEGNEDKDKTFERNVTRFPGYDDVVIKVDKQKITNWTVTEVSEPKQDKNGRWYETFVVTVPLAEPIKDVNKHTVVIDEYAFRANECNNPEMTLDAYPYIKYDIETKYYCVTTACTSVSYYVWGINPDGTFVDKVVNYVGETGEGKTEDNAVAYNDAKNPSSSPAKYPNVASNVKGTYDGHPATLITLEFPAGSLKPNEYKMYFPQHTLQVEGYNSNDEDDLFNKFKVVPEIEFDATSVYADYLTPNKPDKNKTYNISTSTTTIPMYLTGWNKYDEVGANKFVKLVEGSDLLLNGVEGKLECKRIKDGQYEVTFVDEDGKAIGLPRGEYKMTIQKGDVINAYAVSEAEPKIGCSNPEAFDLWIYVEDFTAPDKAIEITTKDYAFNVPVSENPIKVKEGATTTLGGKTVKLSASEKTGKVKVTLPGEDAYEFLASGEYPMTIPANTVQGEYATLTEAVPVQVNVFFEFVDNKSKFDDKDTPNDLVSTVEDVNKDVKNHKKMYYTRTFGSTNYQMLAVPFNIKQSDVEKYFTIYRIDFLRYIDETKSGLNLVSLGKDEIAYANKPYIIKPKSEGDFTIKFESEEGTDVVTPSDGVTDINCSTTKVIFDFYTTTEAKEGTFLTLTKSDGGGVGTATSVPAWRWFVESSNKSVSYIKIAINGVDVDATGIDFVEVAEGETQIFNVAGQRLNAPAKGKVNIINGKKVFVK